MEIIESVKQMSEQARAWKREGRTVVLVPTMGNLHRGHGRLIARARGLGDKVILSCFVNALQFNDKGDLEKYPRTREQDEDVARKLEVDAFFAPAHEEMYPPGFLTTVNVSYLSEKFEGASRPGHFRGVCTVVLKLFNICQPDIAVFGYKDAQQFTVIRHMVRDLSLPVEITGVPTVREASGLAISSRNKQLTDADKEKALCLSRALKRVHFLLKKQGIAHRGELLQAVRSAINSAGEGVEFDYADIVSATTFEPVDLVERGNTFVLVAARVGGVRLIDSTRL